MEASLPQSFGRVESGGNDRDIAGTAAEMATEKFAQVRLVGRRIVAQVPVERHENARRAEPALQGVMSTERVLQDGQTPRLRFEALDRAEPRSVGLSCQREARARQRAIDLNRAAPQTPCSQPTWVPVMPSS